MRSRMIGALLASLLLTGCEGDGSGPEGETTAPATADRAVDSAVDGAVETGAVPTTDDTAATTRPAPGAVDPVDPADHLTDEALLEQTQWVLGLLDEDALGPDLEAVVDRFSEDFLRELPAFQVVTVFPQLRAGGPYTVTEVTEVSAEAGGGTRSAVLSLDAEQPLLMTLALDDEDRIAGLVFVPDTSGEPPVISGWADLDAALTELGGTSQVVVGRVEDGTCTPIHTTAGLEPGGEPAPTGSIFKLVVLAGVVEAVEAGELAWEDELTITEEVKSLPSGILQDREAGSTVTVREAAELMISISDNTATDLLIGAVDRPRMRTAMENAGVDPLRLAPIVTTRQLFILGWGVDQEVRDRWARASVPETRTAQLADLPEDLTLVTPEAVTTPAWQDGVDWPMTGGEVCNVHARLQQLAGTGAGEPVREILSANPGGAVPDGVAYQAFKGCSAPGVLALSYYLEPVETETRADGLVLVVQTRSEEAVDQLRAMTIVEAGLQHLAATGG
ncbi:serine hydrolase [Ornithinimicrobium panacihumi]|uniref:serine hydrolase n=1 Tax=Ornithinimicrobium panacihumi TaxID=2008449 RepID=UPI003F89D472